MSTAQEFIGIILARMLLYNQLAQNSDRDRNTSTRNPAAEI